MLVNPSDLFAGYTVTSRILFIANAIVQVVASDPRRVSLSIYYCSGTTTSLSTLNNVQVTSGVTIAATTPPLKLCLMLDGGLTSQAWYGIGPMGGGNILVCETFFDPSKTRL